MPLGKLWLLQPALEHHWRDCNSPHTQVHMNKHSGIHASLKWQDGGTTSRKWSALCKFSFYLEFTSLQWLSVLSLILWVLQLHRACAADMSAIKVFVCFGLQFKWNQLTSTISSHTSCKLHLSTLGYHWTDYIGITLADASTQWFSSGNPLLICTLEDHWSHTYNEMPSEPQWLMLAPSEVPVAIQCQFAPLEHAGRPLEYHWNTAGSILETHWLAKILPPVAFQWMLWSKFQAHWIATRLPLNYQWLSVGGTIYI